jgi:multimeric flavodoxin WrbA
MEGDIHENKKEIPSSYSQTPATLPEADGNAEKPGDVVIITDLTDENSNLAKMIARFREKLPYKTRIFNISEFPFQGGCLGCFSCAVSGKCIYKDNFDTTLRESIQTADAIVYAFDIKYHSFGSRFKMYNDRNFCNGHRTVTVGMPVGYLISGAYEREENLRMIVEGRAEVGRNFLAGVATDERDTDRRIDEMAEKLSYALKNKLIVAQNFLGVGGMKIFRDLIYQMRGMMRADHKFYKKGGYYNDFPQKKWAQSLLMYLVGFMIGNEKIKKKIGNKMNEGMLMPYKKVLDDLDKKLEKEN